MHDKRYSVFISSTFEDLKDERRAVQDTVLSAGDFPVQMEYFPATDEAAFDLIKSLLDSCDYYILIIGGRYGTLDADGVSFTHKEFRYAASRNIPVLVMLNGARGNISAAKTEATDEGKVRLEEFIVEASRGRTHKTWITMGDLQNGVLAALVHAKQTKPATGWVRGNVVASLEALEELNSVRRENAKYRDAIGSLEIELALPPIPSANDEIIVDILPHAGGNGYLSACGSAAKIRSTWISVFPLFYHNLDWGTNDWHSELSYYINDENSCVEIGSAIAGEAVPIDTKNCFKISKTTLKRLSSYYIEAGLMNPVGAEKVFTETAQKVARRHDIEGRSLSNFKVISGNIAVISPTNPRPDGDDEIPF